jgi:hypothetical protein
MRPFANISSADLPPVKPSAIALGIVFNQAASLAVLAPLFGDTYQRAKAADSSEEFFKSREAATAAASWGTSLVGSGIQTYGTAALINATGTLSYKGAAYLGSLIFMASAAPGVCFNPLRKPNHNTDILQVLAGIVTEKRPLDTVAVGVLTRLFETVGLSMFLTYWGTRTNPFD